VPRPLALLALAIIAFSVPINAAEPEKPAPSEPAKPTTKKTRRYRVVSQEDEARFKEHVARGDRALEAGRLNDAVIAYVDALDIKFDARLSGRLGLVLSMFVPSPKLDVRIANLLLYAIEDAAGISKTERRQFSDTYELTRKRICRLEVVANYVDAMVTINDREPTRSEGAFWTFVVPGKTTLTASLAGRDDITKVFDCFPGKGTLVDFQFPPIPGDEAKTVVVRAPPERVIIHDEIPIEELRIPEPAVKKDEPPRPRFIGGIGPLMIFGAAPSPSFGLDITGQVRREGLSGIAMLKGAWSTGDVKGAPIDVFTASATVGPCVQWQWLDACAFGGAMLFEHRMAPVDPYLLTSDSDIVPAFGLGVGATYAINAKLSARLFADATALTRDVILRIGPPDGPLTNVWSTQRIIFSISASLMFGR